MILYVAGYFALTIMVVIAGILGMCDVICCLISGPTAHEMIYAYSYCPYTGHHCNTVQDGGFEMGNVRIIY